MGTKHSASQMTSHFAQSQVTPVLVEGGTAEAGAPPSPGATQHLHGDSAPALAKGSEHAAASALCRPA